MSTNNIMKNDLVSIIIPTYNGELFINDAINSALAQTHKNIEIVVYDDGSTDKTSSIVCSLNDARIKYFKSENVGLVKNLNRAIKVSEGDYICWLNQDDCFMPQKIECQLLSFKNNSNLGASFSRKLDIDESGKEIELSNPSKFCFKKREEVLLFLFQGCFLSAPTVMIKRSVLYDLDLFNEKYQIAFDFDMWFKIAKKYDVDINTKPLLKFRHHKGNLSREDSASPVTLIETCSVILSAISECTVHDIFPDLKNDFESKKQKDTAISCAYLTWARYIYDNIWWRRYLLMPVLSLTLESQKFNPVYLESFKFAYLVCSDLNLKKEADYYKNCYENLLSELNTCLDLLHDAMKLNDQELSAGLTNKIFTISSDLPQVYKRLSSIFFDIGNFKEAGYYEDIYKELIR